MQIERERDQERQSYKTTVNMNNVGYSVNIDISGLQSSDSMNSTTRNEALLKEVVRLLEHFSSQHPLEAERVFEEPLRWRTTLLASDFKTGYDVSDSTVQSHERDRDGRPLLELSPPTLCVRSISQLSKVVQLAGEKSLEEVRACLDENRDLVVKVLGSSLASVTTADDVQSLVKQVEGDDAGATDPEVNVKLFLLLHSQDKEINAHLPQAVSRKVGPDSTAVKKEVKSLERLCGDGDEQLLKSLRYMSDLEFGNGCRSPPWRQLLGEICHLVIKPCDADVLYVTCSSDGVFLNEGIKQGAEEIGYERTSAFYDNLATLLKSRSQYFAENIDEQDFVEVEEQPQRRLKKIADPVKYGKIHKLVNYLKVTDQTGTVLALVHILDEDLMKPKCQRALLETGGVLILVNLLNTNYSRCKIGALKILSKICLNVKIHNSMVKMGALKTILNLLGSPDKNLKAAAAEALASMATFQSDQTTVRQQGGIQKLMKLLERVPQSAKVTEEQAKDIEVARCAALALWSCSKCDKNKEVIWRAGGISLLRRLLKTPHLNMLAAAVGLLQELASKESFRLAIQAEGMIKDLVKHLRSDHDDLQTQCANTIAKCAEDKRARDLVRQYHGLRLLVSLLAKAPNAELLAAAVGAIWKCSISMENAVKFQEFVSVETLVRLLTDQPEVLLVNVAGALAEFLQVPAARAAIRECEGIKLLASLFSSENEELLVNVAKAVAMSTIDTANIEIVHEHDGIRQMWSLLQHPSPVVQAGAARSLGLCFENATDMKQMRCVSGGFELMVDLLESPDHAVVAGVCAAITAMSKDRTNLGIVSNFRVASVLAKHIDTTDDKLRFHFSEAIRQCSRSAWNREELANAVAPLVGYLRSDDRATQENTVISLYQLSKCHNHCLKMCSNGAVELLIPFMGSDDEEVQEAAVHCVRNIRMLLTNKKARASSPPSRRTK